MPKKARELSALEVKRLSEPGRHAVGGVSGLYLQVTPGAGRSWILRTLVGKRRREMGLGGYPDVGLSDAREAARHARKRLLEGEDPIAQRQAARRALIAEQQKLITFDQCAAAVIEVKRQEARNAKHAKQWETTLATYASPELGQLAVGEIELAHIVNVLEPYWTTKTETMTRVRQRIETVLAWAIARGYREGDNPARWRGNLDAILPKPAKVSKVAHHKALPYEEVGAFMHDLRQRNGTAARALEFTTLTAARSGEVRGATWDEIDLDAGVWTIPGERMKAGREHRVPLSPAAIELLEALPRYEGINFVFPAPRLGQLSDSGMSAVLKRMGVDVTVHGFRSTFRDWTAERTSTPHHVAEMALAHTIKNSAEAAYRRGDMLEKRRRLMEQWADYCAAPVATASVTAIREARA
ncbi:tyrosine-type recombinase/integrase [Vreelandella alkaliphila]|uniref:tyrosine-type recombinase/integrase n=1 Tax=Vreelandella alkaliphila TaxID=272774 RepID=UPI003FD80BC4